MSASPAPPHSAAKLRRLPTTDWLRIEQRHGRAELRLSFTASPPPTNRHLYLPPPPHPPPVQRHPSVCHLHPARLLDFSRPMATSPTQLPSRRSPCTMLSSAMPTPHRLATSLVCTSGLTSLASSLPSSCPLRHSLMLSSPRVVCREVPFNFIRNKSRLWAMALFVFAYGRCSFLSSVSAISTPRAASCVSCQPVEIRKLVYCTARRRASTAWCSVGFFTSAHVVFGRILHFCPSPTPEMRKQTGPMTVPGF